MDHQRKMEIVRLLRSANPEEGYIEVLSEYVDVNRSVYDVLMLLKQEQEDVNKGIKFMQSAQTILTLTIAFGTLIMAFK